MQSVRTFADGAYMDIVLAEKLLTAFHSLTGCGASLTARDGRVLRSIGPCAAFSCPLLRFFPDPGICAECRKNACYGAERFGGKYIYSCPVGFVFSIYCFEIEDEKYFLSAGPVTPKEKAGVPVSADIPKDEFAGFAANVPVMTNEEIGQAALIISAIAEKLGGRDGSPDAVAERQNEINDYIQGIRSRILLGIDSYKPYPYEKEKMLTQAIISGNEQEARRFLNEILGHIFFASANDLDAIKIRAMELTVVISRAALEGGADPNNIYNLNLQFVSEFFRLASIEDVCFSLAEILNRFTKDTFGVSDAKHSALLSRATAFIKTNYMHKITLADVAGHVYISPSYLSRLFREELGVSFSSYLNAVRTEKSKILLISDKLSIIEVAELVGFVDQSYFNKVFKKLTGMTPKRFREKNGAQGGVGKAIRIKRINNERSNDYGNS